MDHKRSLYASWGAEVAVAVLGVDWTVEDIEMPVAAVANVV